MKILLSDIKKYLDKGNIQYRCTSKEDVEITGFSSLKNYKKGTITWIKNISSLDATIQFTLAIVENDIEDYFENAIYCSNSKSVFFGVLEKFFADKKSLKAIGFNTYVSDKVKLGEGVIIGNNCTIDGNIIIGDNTIIYNNVSIINNVKIGANCEIQSGVVIGQDGFGFSKKNNVYKKVAHFGGVSIGDDVFIGANSCITRGTIDDTYIGDGVKIDTLCHIAHNVIIEYNSMLITNSLIYGSCHLKENSYIASAIVKNQCTIGKNSMVGMGSVVTKNIADNKTVLGIPAKEIKR